MVTKKESVDDKIEPEAIQIDSEFDLIREAKEEPANAFRDNIEIHY